MKRLHQSSCQPDQSALWKSLAQLWEQKELCDCTLVSADQRSFHAHRLVLAAASHYFKVLFLGTGQQMLNSASKDDQGVYTVHLNEVNGYSLELILSAIYRLEFKVGSIHGYHILNLQYLLMPW